MRSVTIGSEVLLDDTASRIERASACAVAIRASLLASSTIESHLRSANMLLEGISIASKAMSIRFAERVIVLSTTSTAVPTVLNILPIAFNGPMGFPLYVCIEWVVGYTTCFDGRSQVDYYYASGIVTTTDTVRCEMLS